MGKAQQQATRRDGRLSMRLSLLVAVLMVLVIGAYGAWGVAADRSAAEAKALGEAQVLRDEIMAVWDYVNDVQHKINYNEDGTYDFKDVYCTIAAKDVARRFMRTGPFEIRFVRENPRAATDEPDAFERQALAQLESGGEDSYSEVVDEDGRRFVRLVSTLRVDNNCIPCHGGPAGEKDETGFLKEGMSIGDVGGAVSIVVPLASYEEAIRQEALRETAVFLAVLVLITVAFRIAIKRWVTRPLAQLEQAAMAIEGGSFDIALEGVGSGDEVGHVAEAFSDMAAQLQRAYVGLEETVKERTEELLRANIALERANDALQEESAFKSTILGVMGHELRTPVAAISAAVGSWGDSPDHSAEAEARFLDVVRTKSRTLLSMIENTLDAARIDAGRFAIACEPVDLVDVLNDVETALLPVAQRRGSRVRFDLDPSVPIVSSDWEALRKIVMNLASNAVKFSGDDGCVEVRVTFDRDASQLVIEVSDNGPGMSADEQKAVFGRFVQAESMRLREQGGVGLGLSVVKDLVGLLGGRVGVVSEPGCGCRFTVSLPVEEIG